MKEIKIAIILICLAVDVKGAVKDPGQGMYYCCV